MYSLLTSTGVVVISEIGDKTQLLALILAVRFQKPVPIILGILVATIANHTLAASAGEWVGNMLDPQILRLALGAIFLIMAVWALIPDKMDEEGAQIYPRAGPFVATTIAFFIAEMGDKTQIATAALAVQFGSLLPVVIGTTLGMIIADVPAVLVGKAASHRINLRYVRFAAAGIFAGLAVLSLAGVDFIWM